MKHYKWYEKIWCAGVLKVFSIEINDEYGQNQKFSYYDLNVMNRYFRHRQLQIYTNCTVRKRDQWQQQRRKLIVKLSNFCRPNKANSDSLRTNDNRKPYAAINHI